MKNTTIYIVVIIAIMLVVHFSQSHRELSKEDLIGDWLKTERMVTKDQIAEFTLNIDSTAIFRIKTESGMKAKKGSWSYKPEINFLKNKLSLKGDLKLKYWAHGGDLRIIIVKVRNTRKDVSVDLDGSTYKKALNSTL